ncbi:serine protease DegS [Sinobacterium caligoides]|uniref:Serine protease DegS n=1 Tax=Sinobacterium caligoides TaxID=933926 RepID=A0A3N2E1Y6_9GAMM|nr:trypsin-like peptidase domain-containing protein [Sinobacterium caligoides]ROS06104.1 serine protease DegS [Sinobacterium caligoides]
MKSLLKLFGWPIISGLLLAALTIILFPQYFSSSPAIFLTRPQQQEAASYANAVEIAAPSVVSIYTARRTAPSAHPLLQDPFFRHYSNNSNSSRQQRIERSLGSGVIVQKDGYILTNHHVIKGADQILVSLLDGRESLAVVVGSDPDTDLAVLKIELPSLTPIRFGQAEQSRVGDVVLALGNPFGFGHTVTQGIISATGRYGLALNTYENYIQTDADINPGNSGGALIDVYGRLIGINSAIWSNDGDSQGIGLAIPADIAHNVMREIIANGQVVRGWLGIEVQERSAALAKSSEGIIISAIYRNSPAARAGLLPGDIISKIDDRPLITGRMGMTQVASLKPGQVINVEVIRKGKASSFELSVGKRPTKLD